MTTEWSMLNSWTTSDVVVRGSASVILLHLTRASLVAQLVKNLPAVWETWV